MEPKSRLIGIKPISKDQEKYFTAMEIISKGIIIAQKSKDKGFTFGMELNIKADSKKMPWKA